MKAPGATMFHDAGAIAQCGKCRRYTLDRKALSDRQPACTCGERHYWSGSFKPPGPDAQWHGPAPDAEPAASRAAATAPAGGVPTGAAVAQWCGGEFTKHRSDTGEPEQWITTSVRRLGSAIEALTTATRVAEPSIESVLHAFESKERGIPQAHMAAALVAELRAALPAPAAPPTVEALTELIAHHLTGTYHCNRVWEAWHVGTMSADDFSPVEESDTPREIAEAVLAAAATPTTENVPQ